jgi:CheY-specific phosphatase CheX
MVKSDFAEKEIKEFTGMLVAWLLYHVAGADQEIVQEKKPLVIPQGHADIVSHSVFDVLNKLAALDYSPMKKVEEHDETFDESLAFEVTLTGDVSGYITYAYPLAFVKRMINSMMGFTPETIDELEISALFEVSNIISGAICGQIAKEKNIQCGMKTPFMTQRLDVQPEERIALDTGKGIVEIDLAITYKP